MAVLYVPHFIQFFDGSIPLAGGKLYTYAAGTTAPKATFTTAAGNIENANPVQLDSQGRAIVFLNGAYKFLLTDANDVPVGPNGGVTDNVTSFTTLDSEADPFFESLSGNGTQTAFTVSQDLGTEEKALYVWVDSGLQQSVTNGTFATDTAWTKGSGWTIGSGVATATGAISTAIEQNAAVTLVQGQSYNVTMTITRSAGSLTASVGGTAGTARSANGTYTETIIAGSTQVIAFTGAGFTGTLDNVTVTAAVGEGFQILPPTAYTINGTTLTFNTAPASGTGNIRVSAPLLSVGAASSAAAAAQAAESGALAAQAAAELAETNAQTAEANAETAEANAETAEANAEAAQAAAEAARDLAQNYAAALTGTSTTSLSVGTGSKAFTTQSGKQWSLGQRLRAASDDGVSFIMEGEVTAYSSTSLTILVDYTEGTGTHADWNISIAGSRGSVGPEGPEGPAYSSAQGTDVTANSNTTYTLDYDNGVWYKVTASSSFTLNLTFPSGVYSMIVEAVNFGAYTIAYTDTIEWDSGTPPTYTASGTDHVCFYTDGTGQIYGAVISQAVAV